MSFFEKIKKFNEMYKMPAVSIGPENDPLTRLYNFHDILDEELEEMTEITENMQGTELGSTYFRDDDGNDVGNDAAFLAIKTDLADLLGDIIVYCASEAGRWGIPIEGVLDIIMESNFSKLGADGKPIYDDRGKVLKGPGYWKPEAKIADLLKNS